MDNMLIVWDDACNIGVPIMDEQHKGLVTVINTAFYCASGCRKKEFFIHVLFAFQTYAQLHHDLEEELLEHIKYPYLAAHAASHKKIIQDLSIHIGKVRTTSDPDEAMHFFRTLWFSHINTYDRLYVKYLHEYMRNIE